MGRSLITTSVCRLVAPVVFAVMLAAPLAVIAQPPGPMPGMMGAGNPQDCPDNQPCGYGWGMGMMGMGPGMMGGMGMGRGMGPMGMMGGMGGMMGMGPGMMGLGPLHMLNLSDEQRDKLDKIQDETRRKHWDLTGKIMDESSRLRELYGADTLDARKIGEVYERIFKVKREMIETHVAAMNKVNALLTKEQRDQLKQWRRAGGGMPGAGGMGPGMMGR